MRWFALLLLVTGCAAPHRAAVTSHEVRVYRGREDGLVSVEVWTDTEKGGGCFFLTDPVSYTHLTLPTN